MLPAEGIVEGNDDKSPSNLPVRQEEGSLPVSESISTEGWKTPSRKRLPSSPNSHSLSSPPRPRKSGRCYDRFIPDRTQVDYAFPLGMDLFGSPNKKNAAAQETDATREESHRIYSRVLKNELFGADYELPSTSRPVLSESSFPTQRNTLASPPVKRLLTFRPTKAPRRLHFEEPLNTAAYSLSPVSAESHHVLVSPRKTPRQIPRTPFKVLDAPELADDFYLNLVDWGASNMLSVGLGSCVYLWSACTSRVTKLCDLGPYDAITSVNWVQRGSHLAVGTNRGLVQLWDVTSCKQVRTMNGHTARVGTLAWNEHTLSSGSRDRLIYHRDVRSPSDFVRKLVGHKQEVCGLKWNHESSQLASGGNDNRLLVWNRMQEAPCMKFTEHGAAIKAIAWSPHQHGLLASGGGTADRRIRFWNTLTATPLHSVDTGSQVCNLAWSRNADELVSTHGYSQNQIIVWKHQNMQQLAVLTGHTFRVLYLALSPDGQTIVTGAGDETLRFWNVFNKTKDRHQSTSQLMATPSSIR